MSPHFLGLGTLSACATTRQETSQKPRSITVNDPYSGDRYSGIDRYSGTKNPDDAILITVSGITAIVELFFGKF